MLGTMYKEGQGVSVDLEEAIRCFRRGAELGDVQGHLALAQCYTHGTGVERSEQEALQCYMKAAEMGGCSEKREVVCTRVHPPPPPPPPGSPVALYNVGVHYFSRKGGVELDFAKAAEYFSKAAQLGFAPAQVCGVWCVVCGAHRIEFPCFGNLASSVLVLWLERCF